MNWAFAQVLCLGALLRNREHGFRNVDAGEQAAGADRLGKVDRRGAATAADIEHGFIALRSGFRDAGSPQRRERAIDALLERRPALTGFRVPVRDLIGIRHRSR